MATGQIYSMRRCHQPRLGWSSDDGVAAVSMEELASTVAGGAECAGLGGGDISVMASSRRGDGSASLPLPLLPLLTLAPSLANDSSGSLFSVFKPGL